MRIEHLAIWTNDLEKMRAFYETYFHAKAGARYRNNSKEFESYFLSFGEGFRLELMHKPGILMKDTNTSTEYIGLAHFAIAVGSKEKVNALTEKLRTDGYPIIGEPRITGDGYYESVVLDPEDNRIEITI
jgi:lactoylglutathione lyase